MYILTTEKGNLDCTFKFPKNGSASIKSKEKKEIIDYVIKNREKLLLDWETQVCVKEKMSDEI